MCAPLAAALGRMGYRPAIPLLTKSLADADGYERAWAAEALAHMGATEALPAMQQALAREAGDHGERIRRAIDALEGG